MRSELYAVFQNSLAPDGTIGADHDTFAQPRAILDVSRRMNGRHPICP